MTTKDTNNATQVDERFAGYLEHQFEGKLGDKSRTSKQAWFRKNYLQLLPGDKNASILEIGPGGGEILEFLAIEKAYTQYQAIDLAADVVERCNQIKSNSAILIADSIEYLAENKGRYDLIVMLHVLEHVPKDITVPLLSAIRRALSPNGKLIIEVPNSANPLVGAYYRFDDFTHETGFTAGSLKQVLSMAGFVNIKTAGVKVPTDSLMRKAQAILQWGINAVLRLLMSAYLPRFQAPLSPAIYATAQATSDE